MPEIALPAHFFPVLHVILASWVTGHVLLTKDNVRGAIGWIGLAWLSPFIGPALYFMFGVNRVERRAARLNRDAAPASLAAEKAAQESTVPRGISDQLATLVSVGNRVTGRTLLGGNAVKILRDGDETYPAMLSAIRSARQSVALASYIFEADQGGTPFIDALAEAQSRGVEVRVLIDGIGSGYLWSGIAHLLQQHDIPHARFLHDWRPWRMPLLNMRNHKKIMIVDGAVGFAGGTNIADENLLASNPRHPVTDTHFRIDGPAVQHLMMAFSEDWAFTTGEMLNDSIWWPMIAPAGTAYVRGITEGPDEDMDKLENILLGAISEARMRIRIVTPYFLPNERLVSALILAALRGVAVDVAIPAVSNEIIVDWAMRAHLGPLIDVGVIFHRMPPPFNHSKLMTVDGCWSTIGSANWDERSLRLNFEFNLEIYDDAVTASIDHLINTMTANATILTAESLRNRSLPIKLWDAGTRLLLPYL